MRVLSRIGTSTCSIFTAILFVFFCGASAVLDEPALQLSTTLLLFVLSLLFAAANQLFSLRSLSIVWRITLHLIATAFDFVLVLFVFTGYYKEKGAFAVGATIAYIVVYLAVVLTVFLLKTSAANRKKEETPYKPQY